MASNILGKLRGSWMKDSPADLPIRTVVVVGGTGSGKSEAIKQLGGANPVSKEVPATSSSMASCTKKPSTYEIVREDARYQLIDTMGLMDTQKDDEKGMVALAKHIDPLDSIVGVIYVIAGKINQTEMEICGYLFKSFFDDVESERVIVLRTRCRNWKQLDGQREKETLRKECQLPEKLETAPFIYVDFHSEAKPNMIEKMTSGIWDHMKRWTEPLELSKKLQAATEFNPSHKQEQQATEALESVHSKLDSGKKKNEDLRGEVNKAMGGKSADGHEPKTDPQEKLKKFIAERFDEMSLCFHKRIDEYTSKLGEQLKESLNTEIFTIETKIFSMLNYGQENIQKCAEDQNQSSLGGGLSGMEPK